MSPLAEPATATAADNAAIDKLLRDGELIILAVKPSPWFVLLSSWPVLVGAAMLAGAAWALRETLHLALPQGAIYLVCAAAVFCRVLVACFQWVGRVYLLTNLRAMCIRGVMRVDVAQCPLKRIGRVTLTATLGERVLGLGTLLFETDDDAEPPHATAWMDLARPDDIRQVVEDAINRARFGDGG